MLFPLLSVHFGDKFLEINLGYTPEATLNATGSYSRGLPTALSTLISQANVMTQHDKDDRNKPNITSAGNTQPNRAGRNDKDR